MNLKNNKKFKGTQMKVFYVTNIHPRSHNRGGSSDGYKQTLQQDFNSRYSQLYENLPIKNQQQKNF